MVEPDDSAAEAGVNDNVPGAVIRVDIHPLTADRARDLAFQLVGIEGVGHDLFAIRVATPLADDFGEILVADEYTTAVLAKGDRPFIQQAFDQFDAAIRAILTYRSASYGGAITRRLFWEVKSSAMVTTEIASPIHDDQWGTAVLAIHTSLESIAADDWSGGRPGVQLVTGLQ